MELSFDKLALGFAALFKEKYNIDISIYNFSFIGRRLKCRLEATGSENYENYLELIDANPGERKKFLDSLSINVGHFFRFNLIFEMLAEKFIPKIIDSKIKKEDYSFRIWSSGCSNGEEAYSLAILINECILNLNYPFDVKIFGTDIDEDAISHARKGKYCFDDIKEIKVGLLNKYFIREDDQYQIIPEIKRNVIFSLYNLAEQKSTHPHESIFGSFDIIICRNVLIYFNIACHEFIMEKLHNALSEGGLLILSEYEKPPAGISSGFSKQSDCCSIYKKTGGTGDYAIQV